MKKFNILALTLTLLLPITLFGASRGTKIMLNSHLKELAHKQLEGIIPEKEYSLLVDATLSEKNLRAPASSLQLPLGGINIQFNEGEGSSNTVLSALNDLEKVAIEIRLAKDVPQETKDLVKLTLKTGLKLNASDKVTFVRLPSRAPASVLGDVLETPFWKEAIKNETAQIFAAFVLLSAMGLFLFRSFKSAMVESAEKLAQALRPQSPSQGLSQGAQMTPQLGNKVEDNIWEKQNGKTVSFFAHDCMHIEKFNMFPLALISKHLDGGLAAEVEKNLPKSYFEDMSLKRKSYPVQEEVNELFLRNITEYKRIKNSDLAQSLLKAPPQAIYNIVSEVSSKEALVIINFLTPLKREWVLDKLNTQRKLELIHEKNFSLEDAIHTEEFANLMALLAKDPSEEETTRWTRLTKSHILYPKSFEEDELFFQKTTSISGVDYTSILDALDFFSETDWNELNLQEVALAFYGYSETARQKLESIFPRRSAKWLLSYMEQNIKQDPGFLSPEVSRAREDLQCLVLSMRPIESETDKDKEDQNPLDLQDAA